jgi:hypothetical protein
VRSCEAPEGTRRIYHLHESGAEVVQAYLLQVWGEAVGRFKLLAAQPYGQR